MLEYLTVIAIVLGIFVVYGNMFRQYIMELRDHNKSKRFEEAVAGNLSKEEAERFFSGDVTLQKSIYVVMPLAFTEREISNRFILPIAKELDERKLGVVDRIYTIEGSCGFDISLADFVNGLEVVVNALRSNQAPAGTYIEYDDIELPLYDD